MARTIHDSFVKEWMQELLTYGGSVEVEKQIPGEVRTIDLYFRPDPFAIDRLAELGLLGEMVSQPALLEAFRNPVTGWDIRNCREKVFQLEAELRREAKRDRRKFHFADRPRMWIITPTLSDRIAQQARAAIDPVWGAGVYSLAELDQTAIVAVHQLPQTPQTLFLRLLGRGSVQAAAVEELLSLPIDHPYRRPTLFHISRLQINLNLRQNRTTDLQEILMNLAPAYDQWLQETEAKAIDRGLEQGLEQAQKSIALRMLERNMPIEEIADLTGVSVSVIQTWQKEAD